MQKTCKLRWSQFRQPRPGHESQISPVPACSRLAMALAALSQKHESQSGLSARSESGHAECHKPCRHATPVIHYNTAVSHDPWPPCPVTMSRCSSRYHHFWPELLRGGYCAWSDQAKTLHYLTLTGNSTIITVYTLFHNQKTASSRYIAISCNARFNLVHDIFLLLLCHK